MLRAGAQSSEGLVPWTPGPRRQDRALPGWAGRSGRARSWLWEAGRNQTLQTAVTLLKPHGSSTCLGRQTQEQGPTRVPQAPDGQDPTWARLSREDVQGPSMGACRGRGVGGEASELGNCPHLVFVYCLFLPVRSSGRSGQTYSLRIPGMDTFIRPFQSYLAKCAVHFSSAER